MTFILSFFIGFYIVATLMTCVHIRPYKGGQDL